MGEVLDALVDNFVGHLLLMGLLIIGLIALFKAGAAYLPNGGPAGVLKGVILSV